MQLQVAAQNAQKQAARFLGVFILLVFAVRQSQAQTQATEPAAQPKHSRRLVVSIAHRKLALIENGKVARVYPVAVGADVSPSPTGNFEVRTRLVKPTYYHPGKVIAAGPDNPLGTRWIGLNTKGYGIHGTNVESSIGKAASHGCIRMHRKDLEELFAMVQVGDQVEILRGEHEELATIFDEPAATETTADAADSIAAAEQ